MIPYVMLAAGNLVICLIGIGWVEAVFPDNVYSAVGFLGLYLALGPALFLVPFSRRRPRRRPLLWIWIYLIALILLSITVIFGLEFHRQLVKIQIPLVISDPPRMTLFFLGYYLPAALFLCFALSRLARSGPKALKPALLNPGHGIPVAARSAQTAVEPRAASPAGPIPESNSDAMAAGPRNELTFNRSDAINNRLEEGEPARRDLMETIEPARLKQILDQFAALTNLSLLAYDARGHLLSEPSRENPICQTVQTTAKGQRHCQSHCGRSIGLALQGNDPLFFKCDMNLHVFSIPIRPDEKTRLVLLGGKSFLNDREFADSQSTAVQLDVPIENLNPLGGSI
ncbi:MAG TPA: PocR ligand-binding domain-containing protein, partial [Nitrospiria bacterium]